jgi:hypothetical protein
MRGWFKAKTDGPRLFHFRTPAIVPCKRSAAKRYPEETHGKQSMLPVSCLVELLSTPETNVDVLGSAPARLNPSKRSSILRIPLPFALTEEMHEKGSPSA